MKVDDILNHKLNNDEKQKALQQKKTQYAYSLKYQNTSSHYKEYRREYIKKYRVDKFKEKLTEFLKCKKYYKKHSYILDYDTINECKRKFILILGEKLYNEFLIQYNLIPQQQNNDKYTQKFNCNCGGKYTYKTKARHAKSLIHQSYLDSLHNTSSDDDD